MNIVCAGMPKTCYPYVTFENFKKGLTVPGKLTYKHLKGGVKLIPIEDYEEIEIPSEDQEDILLLSQIVGARFESIQSEKGGSL